MLAPSGELLRAYMALKLNHLRRAARSYLRDRTDQATGRVTSYAVAAGLFAAAALFLIATFFVGLMALYRWVAIAYGQFWGSVPSRPCSWCWPRAAPAWLWPR